MKNENSVTVTKDTFLPRSQYQQTNVSYPNFERSLPSRFFDVWRYSKSVSRPTNNKQNLVTNGPNSNHVSSSKSFRLSSTEQQPLSDTAFLATELKSAQKCPKHNSFDLDPDLKLTISVGKSRFSSKLDGFSSSLLQSSPNSSVLATKLKPAECIKHDSLGQYPDVKQTISVGETDLTSNRITDNSKKDNNTQKPVVEDQKFKSNMALQNENINKVPSKDATIFTPQQEAQSRLFKVESPIICPPNQIPVFSSQLQSVKCPNPNNCMPEDKWSVSLSIGNKPLFNREGNHMKPKKVSCMEFGNQKINGSGDKLNYKTNDISASLKSSLNNSLQVSDRPNTNTESHFWPFFQFSGIKSPSHIFSTMVTPDCYHSCEDTPKESCTLTLSDDDKRNKNALTKHDLEHSFMPESCCKEPAVNSLVTSRESADERACFRAFVPCESIPNSNVPAFVKQESQANQLKQNFSSSWKFWKSWGRASDMSKSDKNFEQPMSQGLRSRASAKAIISDSTSFHVSKYNSNEKQMDKKEKEISSHVIPISYLDCKELFLTQKNDTLKCSQKYTLTMMNPVIRSNFGNNNIKTSGNVQPVPVTELEHLSSLPNLKPTAGSEALNINNCINRISDSTDRTKYASLSQSGLKLQMQNSCKGFFLVKCLHQLSHQNM